MSRLILLGIAALFIVPLALLIWAYITVVGLMVDRLDVSTWEAVAILLVTHAVFGAHTVRTSR